MSTTQKPRQLRCMPIQVLSRHHLAQCAASPPASSRVFVPHHVLFHSVAVCLFIFFSFPYDCTIPSNTTCPRLVSTIEGLWYNQGNTITAIALACEIAALEPVCGLSLLPGYLRRPLVRWAPTGHRVLMRSNFLDIITRQGK